MATLHVTVRDTRTQALRPCWIWIEDGAGRVMNDYGTRNLPGFPSGGREKLELAAGEYRMRVHCGLSFQWIDKTFTVGSHNETRLDLPLQPHVALRERGWFCADIHNHPRNVTPRELVEYLAARGIDYLSICQGWLVPPSSFRAHDGEALAEYLACANTEHTRVHMGAEYPKTRYGHVCWFSIPPLPDPLGMYDDFHDEAYYNAVPVCSEPLAHPSRQIPFKTESNFNKILRMKARGGVTMAPHPTSWWTECPGQKIISTNIAADYILSLFAGKLYDTLAVMGYDAEHIFYQNFWFELLNRGHKIAGVAETDGDLTGRHAVGQLRCFTHAERPEFDLQRYLSAVKAGHTFVSSGPLLFVTSEDESLPGSWLPQGIPHTLTVEAHSDPHPDEYLSWLVLYRNGSVAEIIDVEASRPRELRHLFKIPAELERAWYVVKVYGSTRPERREFVDIRHYAELCRNEVHGEYKNIRQVAFTNPFYIEPAGYREPAEIQPSVRGRILCKATGNPLDAQIRVLHAGASVHETSTDGHGRFELTLPLTDELEIEAHGYSVLTLNVPVHYSPIADLIDEIIAGRWALDGNACWQPGQVPFEVFQYEQLRELLLRGFDWEIALERQ